MTLQSLPPLATSYSAAQLRAIDETLLEVQGLWRQMGPRFDTGWGQVGPYITAVISSAQRDIATRATEYIPAILEDTGQVRAVEAKADTNINALVGVAGTGYQVDDTLSVATIRAKQAVEAGKSPITALGLAGDWLLMSATTILADTARTAESIGRYTRPVGGYVRMVHGGACGRCVVQAGKWFRTNQGFLRHPRCKCTHIPTSEGLAGDWQTNPTDYFHSLTAPQQIKLMGSKANAQAVVDGADVGQIINAYRRTSGMRFAQSGPIKVRNGAKFTTEGTTRRGLAGQQQAGLRRNGPSQQRLMPETIAARAADESERLRLLRLYGWIKDEAAISRGRTIFAEQRRISRNARAVERRAEQAAAKAGTPVTAGGAAGGAKPPTTGRGAGFGPEPDPSDKDAHKAYWKARQDALAVDFKGEILEAHEVRFVERFMDAGERLEWIAKDTVNYKPTNDFIWSSNGRMVVELKSTKARFTTIDGRIQDAVMKASRQAVVKQNFVIDLADQTLTDRLRDQLAGYNIGRRKYLIRRMYVMSEGRIEEIILRN